ncbi:MAG: M23 family metallopeptidase [Alphaproteobacteria bacterium]
MKLLGILLLMLVAPVADALELHGRMTQGGLIRGRTEPRAVAMLDGRTLRVSPNGDFIFGFNRDAPPKAILSVRLPDGTVTEKVLDVTPREYAIQRIDGLPAKMVTPPPEVLARIRAENEAIAAVRKSDRDATHFLGDWIRPADGPVTGVYGSQRILNGEPRQPHYGIDYAGPVGAPVVAPAPGVVVLARDDMYYTGGTLILDHGHGLTSAFLHLSRVEVKPGETVARGQRIGAIGATGRATGPHLDWRINWFDRRIDPALLLSPQPAN